MPRPMYTKQSQISALSCLFSPVTPFAKELQISLTNARDYLATPLSRITGLPQIT